MHVITLLTSLLNLIYLLEFIKLNESFLISMNIFLFFSVFLAAIFSRDDQSIDLPISKIIFSPQVAFYVFFFVVFYLPYFAYAMSGHNLADSLFIVETFSQNGTEAIAITGLALVAFFYGHFLGRANVANMEFCDSSLWNFKLANLILFLGVILLFSGSGSAAAMISGYKAGDLGSNTDNGVFYLCIHFSMVLAAVFVYEKYKKLPKDALSYITLFFNVLFLMFLLIAGDRNSFMLIGSVYFWGVYLYLRTVNLPMLFAVVFLSFTTYLVVENYRMEESKSLSGLFLSVDASRLSSSYRDFLSGSFNNSTIVTRAMFDAVREHGHFYGKFKVIGFMGVVPYSRSLVFDKNDPYPTSAEVMTDTVLGQDATWSVGTNVIADLFVDGGLLLVVLGMFILGWLTKSFTTFKPKSLPQMMFCLLWIAFVFQISRYTYDFPVRTMVWIWFSFLIFSRLEKFSGK